ncbi:hypothetical protein DYB34_014084 [Aphanomyces astaci]|uniref:NAD-dependent epimerase/dehydratase domain-containing protein n=1 Tax=Aphanomyces astaci TaxID=112090 RepID=A0A3R6XC27_APHAT|nr:hypothetical protein DYB34_014084 [Aphanomyces astaci]
MSKVAFVTGATGFLGQNLVNSLLEQHWTVIAFVRATSVTAPLTARGGVTCVVGNMLDAASIAAAMPLDVDAVFHVAANTSLWVATHRLQYEENVYGTKAMCDAAVQRRAKRFVFVSSISAYGYVPHVLVETTPDDGRRDYSMNYSRSKRDAEVVVRDAIASHGLDAVIVNPGQIVGPHDTKNFSRIFLMLAKNRLDGIPPGMGSFAYAPDVAEATIAAAERGRVGENYLLGGETASYRDLIVNAATLMGKKETRRPLPRWVLLLLGRLYDLYSVYWSHVEPEISYDAAYEVCATSIVDSTKAKTELGYQTRTLGEILPPTLHWLESNGHFAT